MIKIPAEFAQMMRAVYPSQGQRWLDNLPQLLAHYAELWELSHLSTIDNLSYNYVATAVQDGQHPVVLKVGVPNPELLNEGAALRLYNGRGAVKLLAADAENGVYLLERVMPGTPVHQVVDDDEATRIAAQVMQTLWRPVPENHSFPTLEKWTWAFGRLRKRFNGGTGPLPETLVAKTEALFAELLDTSTASYVLHGDLHHDNILAAADGWLAIDPKGLIGDPYYEATPLLYNPGSYLFAQSDPKAVLQRRLDILAETLGFDRQRLTQYGFCQCLLSAVWSVEDNTDWRYVVYCAELFEL